MLVLRRSLERKRRSPLPPDILHSRLSVNSTLFRAAFARSRSSSRVNPHSSYRRATRAPLARTYAVSSCPPPASVSRWQRPPIAARHRHTDGLSAPGTRWQLDPDRSSLVSCQSDRVAGRTGSGAVRSGLRVPPWVVSLNAPPHGSRRSSRYASRVSTVPIV